MPVQNLSFISKADVIENKLHASNGNSAAAIPLEIGVVMGPVLGILTGLSILTIPGFGIFYGAGAAVGALAGLDVGIIGGGIASLLVRLGIRDKSEAYQEYLKNGKYIITISGDHKLAEQAKKILHTVGQHVELQHHQ